MKKGEVVTYIEACESSAREWDDCARHLEDLVREKPHLPAEAKAKLLREAGAARRQAAWWRSGNP